jgi:hypothetical protein
MPQKLYPSLSKPGAVLCVSLLLAMTGCVTHVERPHARHGHRPYLQPASTVVVVELDDYVYYPGHQIYYGSRTRRYYSMEGSSWVARPAPAHISVDVLLSSPSVAVDFHDGIAIHHADVVRSYPQSWKHNGGNHGHKNDRHKDSKRGKKADKRN